MTNDLLNRIAELRVELDSADGAIREELLDHLEQAVAGLQAQSVDAPCWTNSVLASRVDQKVEDMFDNMPV